MALKAGIAALAVLFAAYPAGAGSRITVVNGDPIGQGLNDPAPVTPVGGNSGTTLGQQRLNAFQQAADIWATILDSPVEIRVQAHFTALSCDTTSAILAQTGPTQLLSDFSPNAGFPGPEFAGTWYPVALANRRSGRDLLASVDDMTVNFNSNLGLPSCAFSWYYGLDNNHGGGVDLVTTLLHEFAHGFGFLTVVGQNTGEEFSGLNAQGHIVNGPDIYERQILDISTGKLWPEMTNAERLTSSTNTGKLVWMGAFVTATVPGVMHGTPTLTVSAPSSVAGDYLIGLAAFGPALTSGGITGTLVAALDPADMVGPTTFDACSPVTNASALAGRVALIDRGSCTFVVKTLNVQAAGATAAIIANNVDGSPPGLGGSDPTVTIPAVSITKADGATLRAALGSGVTVSLYLDSRRLAGTDGASHLLLFAPNPYQGGSSISHWDTSASPNLLLEPAISSDLTHGVDLTLAALRDIGWYPDIPAREPLSGVHRTRTTHVTPRP